MTPDEAQAALERLHADVDRRASALAARHGPRLRCRRGCSACCVDGITVFEIEAERIRRHRGELLSEGTPHAPGACAFLDDDGACRVYADRPFVCRTQGLPLRFLVEDESGDVVEHRDLCELNVPDGPALESLPEEDCWLLGETELALRHLQESLDPSAPRTPLRALFGRG